MFYTNLIDIYHKRTFLEEGYPFNRYYPLLQHFIAEEVSLNTNYISPYRFSIYNGINLKDTLNLFIALSGDDGIFDRLYQYDCECDTSHVLESNDLENFSCYKCGEEIAEINLALSNITLLFRLKPELEDDMVKELKKASSSFELIERNHSSKEDSKKVEKGALNDLLRDSDAKKQNPELSAVDRELMKAIVS